MTVAGCSSSETSSTDAATDTGSKADSGPQDEGGMMALYGDAPDTGEIGIDASLYGNAPLPDGGDGG